MWEAVSAEGLVEDPAENAKIINDFEEKMKDLREKGEAKTRREVLTLGVPCQGLARETTYCPCKRREAVICLFTSMEILVYQKLLMG